MQLSPTQNGGDSLPREERRLRPRVKLSWRVQLVRISDQKAFMTETTNLSSGGFHFHSAYPFNEGDNLECTFQLPQYYGPAPMELRCQASVVRVRQASAAEPFGIGCRLDEHVLSESIHLPGE